MSDHHDMADRIRETEEALTGRPRRDFSLRFDSQRISVRCRGLLIFDDVCLDVGSYTVPLTPQIQHACAIIRQEVQRHSFKDT